MHVIGRSVACAAKNHDRTMDAIGLFDAVDSAVRGPANPCRVISAESRDGDADGHVCVAMTGTGLVLLEIQRAIAAMQPRMATPPAIACHCRCATVGVAKGEAQAGLTRAAVDVFLKNGWST
jgi:predicted ATP-dependent serine protease